MDWRHTSYDDSFGKRAKWSIFRSGISSNSAVAGELPDGLWHDHGFTVDEVLLGVACAGPPYWNWCGFDICTLDGVHNDAVR
jgi:hypothetical protein